MCGNFQLYIWRLNPKHALSFNSPPGNKLVITLTEEVIIPPEPEKQNENPITEKKFQNLSDFEINFCNESDFGLKKIQALDFELKFFQGIGF